MPDNLKRTAALLARKVAEEFAASVSTEESAALVRVLPVLAARKADAGETVTEDFLRDSASRGSGHVSVLIEQFNDHKRDHDPTYDSVLADLGNRDPLQHIVLDRSVWEAMPVPQKLKLRDRAIREGCIEQLKFMSRQEDLYHLRDLSENIYLSMAAQGGHLSVVKFFYEHFDQGSRRLITYNNLDNSLEIAATKGSLDIVRYLHGNKAGVSVRDKDLLQKASENGHLNVVKYLMEERGLVLNRGNIAIDAAVKNGHLAVVEYLFRVLDYSGPSVAGRHLISLAMGESHLPVVRFLHEQGCAFDANDMVVICKLHDAADIADYLYEQGMRPAPDLIEHDLKTISLWKKCTGIAPPAGCKKFRPDHFRLPAFTAAQNIFAREGYKIRERNGYAYQLSVLFGSEDRLLRYLRKWGNYKNKQPLHDISHMIKIPQEGGFDAKAWGDAVLKYGPGMAAYVKFAHKLPPPESLKQVREAAAQFVYARAGEYPALAAIGCELNVEEEDFNKALDLYLAQKKKGFPTKRIPDITIDGTEFGIPGAKFTRLAADDPRGLFLGEYTNCCQSVGGAGEDCAIHGFTSPDSGFYVVTSAQGDIIGQCWAWRSERGSLVLDSLETLGDRVTSEQWIALLSVFANRLKTNPGDIRGLLVGTGGGTPGLDFEKADMAATPRNYNGYRDSKMQYMVWPKLPTAASFKSTSITKLRIEDFF